MAPGTNHSRWIVSLICGLLASVHADAQANVHLVMTDRVAIGSTEFDLSVRDLVRDPQGFLWIGSEQGLFRYDGYDFEPFTGEEQGGPNLSNVTIRGLMGDSAGNLWIGTDNDVHVLLADRRTIRTLRIPSEYQTRWSSQWQTHVEFTEMQDRVWISNELGMVWITNIPQSASDSVRILHGVQTIEYATQCLPVRDTMLIMHSELYALVCNARGDILDTVDLPQLQSIVKVNARIFCVDRWKLMELLPGMRFKSLVSFTPSNATHTIHKLYAGGDHGIWISTLNGLMKYDLESGTLIDYTPALKSSQFFYQYQYFNSGTQDGDRFWLGTSKGLYHIYAPSRQEFQVIHPEPEAGNGNFSTRGLLELPDGDLLAGSYAGLLRFTSSGMQRAKEYLFYDPADGKSKNPLTYAMLRDDNTIWLACEGPGLLKFSLKDDSITSIIDLDTLYSSEFGKPYSWSKCIIRDEAQNLIIGCVKGVYLMDKDSHLSWLEPGGDQTLRHKMIHALAIGPDGTLWIGTTLGLFSVGPQRDQLLGHPIGNELLSVNAISIGETGDLWIGTRGSGLYHYDQQTGVAEQFTVRKGLPDNTVTAIIPAGSNLWISTNRGLSHFDPASGEFHNYYFGDGLAHDEFNHGSYLKDSHGLLYFGGVDGITKFDPADFDARHHTHPIKLSRVSWHDGAAGITRHHLFDIDALSEIHLAHRDKYFSVSFSDRDPGGQGEQRYAYRIHGLHSDWQQLGKKNSIEFSGLRPGNYTLEIRTVSGTSALNTDILRVPVIIDRALYKTWQAYFLYILCLGGAVALLIRSYYRRRHLRNQLQLELDHSLKLEEINRSKSTFFANITHEFKTPLTLIKGPAEEIEKQSNDPGVSRNARLITRNANAILSLVNQLLDLNKLEADLDTAQFYRLDLISHLEKWVENFRPLAERKMIHLELISIESGVYLDFDPVKLEQVFSNLLSNAIKFTPEYGRISCQVEGTSMDAHSRKECLSIAVRDTGTGVEEGEREHIFERFFQGRNSVLGGTGVGLSFVRELVRLHNGRVEIDPNYRAGACFRVYLPLVQEKVAKAHQPQVVSPEERQMHESPAGTVTREDQKPIILVAEDHEEVAQLISDILSEHAVVRLTNNGRMAFEEAHAVIPDLVITDVMMPVMDGFTLTHQLKNDLYTSHIPVIMLTAKGTQEDRIEGRQHGADVYLHKPFSPTELQYVVRNLLRLKQQLQHQATTQIATDVHRPELTNERDKVFYNEFLAYIELHLEDSGLSVQQLADAMGVSRTQLHRKLKAITGQSANALIRAVRLQKGLSMLHHSGKNVSEIAYDVGFSSPSYFAESFKEYFGYTPSEALKR